MNFDWQTGIALLLCALALSYIVSRWWRLWRGQASGCGGGGCNNCPANEAKNKEVNSGFVSLDSLKNTPSPSTRE